MIPTTVNEEFISYYLVDKPVFSVNSSGHAPDP